MSLLDAVLAFRDRLARLTAHGMLALECTFCGRIILVESRLGPLHCPHCQQRTIRVWCAVEVTVVPEVFDELVDDVTEDEVPPDAH